MKESAAQQAKALRDLVVSVAYAEHWLRDTEVFEAACKAAGLEYRAGYGLFEPAMVQVRNPFEAG